MSIGICETIKEKKIMVYPAYFVWSNGFLSLAIRLIQNEEK